MFPQVDWKITSRVILEGRGLRAQRRKVRGLTGITGRIYKDSNGHPVALVIEDLISDNELRVAKPSSIVEVQSLFERNLKALVAVLEKMKSPPSRILFPGGGTARLSDEFIAACDRLGIRCDIVPPPYEVQLPQVDLPGALEHRYFERECRVA